MKRECFERRNSYLEKKILLFFALCLNLEIRLGELPVQLYNSTFVLIAFSRIRRDMGVRLEGDGRLQFDSIVILLFEIELLAEIFVFV